MQRNRGNSFAYHGPVSITEHANLFGDSDEMGDDLMDSGFDERLSEAYRQKRFITQQTRLRFSSTNKNTHIDKD